MSLNHSDVTNHIIENNRTFKKFAPFYDAIDVVAGRFRKAISKYLADYNTVLDIACGTGSQAVDLSKHSGNIVGVDLSEDMLAKARKKARGMNNVQFMRADATSLPFRNHHFEASIISFSLHDMPYDIAMAVLQEAKRVTKAGGVIVIADYGQSCNPLVKRACMRICGLWETQHFTRFMQKSIEDYTEPLGLNVEERHNYYLGAATIIVVRL